MIKTLNNLNEPVKSSESTGSGEPLELNMSENEIIEQRKKIVELSNESILHGYDMAVDLLLLNNEISAVELLRNNRAIIATGLQNTVEGRLDIKQ